MSNLADLEKKINSELATKIKFSEIKHQQLYLNIDCKDLFDVLFFLKNNISTKFRQLVDITAVDYPEENERFKIVLLISAISTSIVNWLNLINDDLIPVAKLELTIFSRS